MEKQIEMLICYGYYPRNISVSWENSSIAPQEEFNEFLNCRHSFNMLNYLSFEPYYELINFFSYYSFNLISFLENIRRLNINIENNDQLRFFVSYDGNIFIGFYNYYNSRMPTDTRYNLDEIQAEIRKDNINGISLVPKDNMLHRLCISNKCINRCFVRRPDGTLLVKHNTLQSYQKSWIILKKKLSRELHNITIDELHHEFHTIMEFIKPLTRSAFRYPEKIDNTKLILV